MTCRVLSNCRDLCAMLMAAWRCDLVQRGRVRAVGSHAAPLGLVCFVCAVNATCHYVTTAKRLNVLSDVHAGERAVPRGRCCGSVGGIEG
jgi:hypothetical protein